MHELALRTVEVFKALGDPARLKIIRLLASNTIDPICVTDLARMLEMTQPAVSQHIKVLKNVGILKASKEGNKVFYSVDVERFKTHKADVDALFAMAFRKCPGVEPFEGKGQS